MYVYKTHIYPKYIKYCLLKVHREDISRICSNKHDKKSCDYKYTRVLSSFCFSTSITPESLINYSYISKFLNNIQFMFSI